jgi:bifunctional NMN adenylyltransferase/nudix hydrolase
MGMYDICAFAGRMRPPTEPHLKNIRACLLSGQYAFIFVGSAFEAPHFKNPHTFDEVVGMIRGSLTPAENDRVYIFPVEDRESNLQWVRDVQRITTREAANLKLGHEPRIALVGYAKDGTSYYLKMFPEWGAVATQAVLGEQELPVSATDIRHSIYDAEDPAAQVELLYRSEPQVIPQGTYVFLRQWVHTAQFELMRAEYKFMVKEYLPLFPKNPFTDDPQQFPCADGFMYHAGSVCLVQRGQMPGLGLWASPGGHKRAYQTFEEAMLDEVNQETQILDLNDWLTRDMLASFIRGEKMLDNPWRSNREVTFSMAYGLVIPAHYPRPAIKGADDARQARWWNTDEVVRSMMFEDLYNPFEYFLHQFDDLSI